MKPTQSCMAAAALATFGLILGGCQADYSADITNKTPQPVFAQIFSKTGSGAVLGNYKRLGPGDRAFLGPVRNQKDNGAYLALDTMPNPGTPVTVDLPPGVSFFEIQQDGTGTAGPLRVIPKQ